MAIDRSDAPNLAEYMYAIRLGASDWSIAILRCIHLSLHATVHRGGGLPTTDGPPATTNQCIPTLHVQTEELSSGSCSFSMGSKLGESVNTCQIAIFPALVISEYAGLGRV